MFITVGIPTYNSLKFVEQCLDSVLAQTYTDMEIVVYDNESTDGTYEYLKDRNTDGFGLVSLPNVHPNSYQEAVEHAIEHCKSEYITFIGSDDYVDKDYISRCAHILEKHVGTSMQSGLIGVNEQGNIVNHILHTYNTLEEFKQLCMTGSPVTTPSVFYHKSIWPIFFSCREAHEANNLPEVGVGDYDMWCGLADRGIPIIAVDGFLGYYYRWHQGQATWQVHKSHSQYDGLIQEYWRKKWKM